MTNQHYVAEGVLRTSSNEYVRWGAELGWEVCGVVDEKTGTTLTVFWKQAGTELPRALPSWKNYIAR